MDAPAAAAGAGTTGAARRVADLRSGGWCRCRTQGVLTAVCPGAVGPVEAAKGGASTVPEDNLNPTTTVAAHEGSKR